MDCGRGERTWHRTDLEKALVAWVDRSPPPGLTGALLAAHLEAGSAFLLFDGLDEVPVSQHVQGATTYPRELLLSGLADALPDWQKAGNRILLTSRPYGLDEAGLHRLGLPSALRSNRYRSPCRICSSPAGSTRSARRSVIPDLIATIRGRDDLAPLVENPMLLTALCVLYDSGGRLPEDRYELYKRIVNNVLHSRYPGDARQREPVLRRLEAIAYGMHTGERAAQRRGSTRRPPRSAGSKRNSCLARFAELNPALREGSGRFRCATGGTVDAFRPAAAAAERPGCLLSSELSGVSGGAAHRPHRQTTSSRSSASAWAGSGVAARRCCFCSPPRSSTKTPSGDWGCSTVCLRTRTGPRSRPSRGRGVHRRGAGAVLGQELPVPEALAEVFRRLALDAIEDEIELQARQAIGLCLGRLGDPRIPDLRDPSAYVEVPAGTYPYGDKKKTVVEIAAPFRLGRYPVTNGQFQDFHRGSAAMKNGSGGRTPAGRGCKRRG